MAEKDPDPALPIVFDSDVIIEYLRGRGGARDVLNGVPFALRQTSDMVRLEVLQGARDRTEMAVIDRFFDRTFERVLPMTPVVSARALELMRRYRLSAGLRAADSIIAATALSLPGRLATGNVRHFQKIDGLSLLPYRG